MADQDIPFERIGGYRILRRLATGGTSDVLLARAEGPHGFERTVVLKLLLQQFRREQPMEKMFAREAAAYARLSHPAIVKLYDFFSAEGQLVMVLEYVDGLPLNRFRAMLRKSGDALDDRASIFVASRVFAALAAAHGARDPETGEFTPVIHRDVNPSNVLIPWDGHVKLADFGIAKVAGVSSDTQSGFIKGTYGYMAPEQVRGEPVTVRTDVYAASLLLWELLARRKAIQRGALPEMEVLRAMAEPSLPSLDVLRPDLPARLRELVARGLEPVPDQRSVTAEEMLVVLRESVTSNEGRNVLVDLLSRVRPATSDLASTQSRPPPAVAAGSSESTREIVALPDVRATEPSLSAFARTALGVGQVAAVAAPPPPPAPPQPTTGKQLQTLAFGQSNEPPTTRRQAPPQSAKGGAMAKTLTGMSPGAPAVTGVPVVSVGPMPGASLVPPASIAPPVFPPSPPPPPPGPPSVATAVASPALLPAPFGVAPSAALQATLPVPLSVPPAPLPPTGSAPMAVPLAAAPSPLVLAPAGFPSDPPPPPRRIDPNEVTVAIARAGSGGSYALVAGIAFVASGLLVGALWLVRRSAAPPPARPAASANVAASTPAAKPPATGTVPAPTASPPTTGTVSARPPPTPAPAPAPAPSVTAAPVASPAAAPAPTPPSSSPPPAAHQAAASPAAASPAPSLSSDSGRILTPAALGSHRVFVDGRYAGDTPAPIVVKCGAHKVKIGSHGAVRDVDVPCGQDVTVSGK